MPSWRSDNVNRWKCPYRAPAPLSMFLLALTANAFVIVWTSINASERSEKNEPLLHKHARLNQLHQDDEENAFAACLMVKDDNNLLPEWLAYHYTVLPLRYVVVANDNCYSDSATQDPRSILQRFSDTLPSFQYWLWNMTNVMDSGSCRDSHQSNTSKEGAHHRFVNRQRHFVQQCLAFLQKQQHTLLGSRIAWTTLIDIDEYIVPHRWSQSENQQFTSDAVHIRQRYIGLSSSQLAAPTSAQQLARPAIFRTAASIMAELDRSSEQTGANGQSNVTQTARSCYTMPRLLVGSLVNHSCSAEHPTRQWIFDLVQQSYGGIERFNTLRYVQTAKKGDFAASKFGKVMIDLRRLSPEKVSSTLPRNIHRPYLPDCGSAVVAPYEDAVLVVHHYLGSFEQYIARGARDQRRNRREWEQRAHHNSDTVCDQFIESWVAHFFDAVGEMNAVYILTGQRQT
jgi:hypothetical protein